MTLDKARELAAQVWCQPTTSMIEMDVRLAEAFAVVLAEQVAAEREACAAECTVLVIHDGKGWHRNCIEIRDAIRARGET